MQMYLSIKRVLDCIGAIVMLPFVFLVIVVFAPIIWITDKGPVFFVAERSGKGYKPFKMYKLRSMYTNSPNLKNPDGSTFNSDNDPRVTPIGRFLRKTSLDEFPQFINVLIGDMSFIGPRPKLFNPARTLDSFNIDQQKSFSVRPGITGYAQAYYRNSISQNEKYHWDAYYADHVSFLMDVKILIHTIISVLHHKNINTVHSV